MASSRPQGVSISRAALAVCRGAPLPTGEEEALRRTPFPCDVASPGEVLSNFTIDDDAAVALQTL
jgi:hypothetical protein